MCAKLLVNGIVDPMIEPVHIQAVYLRFHGIGIRHLFLFLSPLHKKMVGWDLLCRDQYRIVTHLLHFLHAVFLPRVKNLHLHRIGFPEQGCHKYMGLPDHPGAQYCLWSAALCIFQRLNLRPLHIIFQS